MRETEFFDAFVAVVESGSISEAARHLGVPRATLSRQLAQLEERLGVRLIHRTTRRLVNTPAGDALYPRAKALVEAGRAAVDAVQRLDDVPRGVLRITGSPLETMQMGALLGEYLQRYAEVAVEFVATPKHVDLFADPFDVAFRGGNTPSEPLMSERLISTELVACASPDYLARNSTVSTVEDLRDHECLRGFIQGTRATTEWPLRNGQRVPVNGRLVSNDLRVRLGAALSGLGIAMVPKPMAHKHLERGELESILPQVLGSSAVLSLVWVERQFIEPKIRAFVALASEWARDGKLFQL
ncbi:MAG: LysR family transcriptional regulator [Myxococcota bacterium]